jgi:hypothetical protein
MAGIRDVLPHTGASRRYTARQSSEIAPPDLQEALFERGARLPAVSVSAADSNLVCTPLSLW